MGRHTKRVIDESGVDKRAVGYYSTPSFITQFLTNKMLQINPSGSRVLDPCVGKEEMLFAFYDAGKAIDSFDIINYENHSFSNFRQADFLRVYAKAKDQCPAGRAIDWAYDYYIANPPYNCHEVDYITNQKDHLSQTFGDIGVLNMYSMFLAALIDCAKPGALIGVITSDSFLTARLHEPLRRRVLQECTVHYLILCPTDLFRDQQADVRTCLLILEKGKQSSVMVKTSGRPTDALELQQIIATNKFQKVPQSQLHLRSPHDRHEFVVDCPAPILDLFSSGRLSQSYPCITGISTGNDKMFLSSVKTEGFTTPFYKNPGTNRFFAPPNAYLTDDFQQHASRRSNFIVRNSRYLYREGIVCSSMGVTFAAAYLPPGSTFGVNTAIIPPSRDLWWLLAYLNSSLVTYFVRGVLLRSNMITSGYVARIPLVNLSDGSKVRLGNLAMQEYNRRKIEWTARSKSSTKNEAIDEIDNVIYTDIGLREDVRHHIAQFQQHLLKRT